MGKKKSIDAVNEEKRKYEKNSKKDKEKYIWQTVAETDFSEIQKEYPYLKKDSRGTYLIDREGNRKEVILPYIPVIDDDSCLRVLFQKPKGRKNQPFPYCVIDNKEHITNVLINNKKDMPVKWRITPNKSPKEIKKR